MFIRAERTVHSAMSITTNQHHTTSTQHIECGPSRQARDSKDLNTIIGQFKQFNPFNTQDSSLRCVVTGLTAKEGDGINCDDAEKVGMQIQESLDNLTFNQAIVKRSMKVKTLTMLKPGVKINTETVHVDPNILFQRLIILIERSEDMTSYFEYELTPEPTSLFKDGFMRKPNKALLGRALTKNSSNTTQETTKIVLDGGALLHRVHWNIPSTFADVIQQYCHYVTKKYGSVTVVFDGYESSTKDHEHKRRGKAKISDFTLQPETELNCKQADFLSNNNNKSLLIKSLIRALRSAGHECINCPDDADKTIVSEALKKACQGSHTTVVADDTDILVLLLSMWEPTMSDVILRHEPV